MDPETVTIARTSAEHLFKVLGFAHSYQWTLERMQKMMLTLPIVLKNPNARDRLAICSEGTRDMAKTIVDALANGKPILVFFDAESPLAP